MLNSREFKRFTRVRGQVPELWEELINKAKLGDISEFADQWERKEWDDEGYIPKGARDDQFRLGLGDGSGGPSAAHPTAAGSVSAGTSSGTGRGKRPRESG